MSHDFISQVFGAPSPAQINTDMVSQSAVSLSSLLYYLFSLVHLFTLSFFPFFYLSFFLSLSLSLLLSLSLSLCSSFSLFFSFFSSFLLSFFPSFVHSFTHSLHLSSQPSLPALDNRLSFRVRGICSQLQETRQFQMKVYTRTCTCSCACINTCAYLVFRMS